MRKSIVSPTIVSALPVSDAWRDLVRIARVDMTSEDAAFPIENALGKATSTGWRAASTGPQVIRLHFDEPLAIRRIQLHFQDTASERSQEFALLAHSDTGATTEIVRQQWNFSPGASSEELEDYAVSLTGVTTLELQIDPDRAHNPSESKTYASLAGLKIA